MPDEFDVPQELQAAERNLKDMEFGLYNTRAVPNPLIGTKKFAPVYLDVT
jgi:hypothetical protein